MKRLAGASLLFCCLAGCAAGAPPPTPENAAWRPVAVEAAPYQLRGDAAPDEAIGVGRLVYRGGLDLSSPDPAFGGFSGLLVSEDGTRLLAVSDRGQWLEARLDYNAHGRPSGLAEARMAALVDKDGVVLAGPVADAEGLARSGDGRLFLSFEREHRVDAYRIDEAGMIVFDAAIAAFGEDEAPPYNESLEAAVVLDDGLMVLAEAPFAAGGLGRVIAPDGTRRTIDYAPAKDFAVTEAARLGEDLYMVERAYSPLRGPRARLVRAGVPSAEDARIEGEELARLGGFTVVDNMEALDARRGENGRTLLYVLSDDNHSSRQKTILLVFEVQDEQGE